MKRLRKLEAWLTSLVLTYQDPKQRPRRNFSNLTSLAPPSQLYAISMRRDGADFTVILLTHESNVPNCTTRAVELGDLEELAEFAEGADEFFKTSTVKRQAYPELKQFIFPELRAGAEACIQLSDWLRRQPKNPPLGLGVTNQGQSILQTEHPGAFWNVVRKGKLPPVREFLIALSERRLRTKAVSPANGSAPAQQPADLPQLQIYGAFHEPALYFGPAVFPSIRQMILNQLVIPSMTRFIVATGYVGGVPTCLSNDGLLVAFSADKRTALSAINQVFAALSRAGVPSFAASSGELLTISGFNLLTGAVGSSQSAVIPRNEPDHWFEPRRLRNSYCLPWESAAAAIKIAHACAMGETTAVLSLRLYDAFTLLGRESVSEAFVVAWSVIEAVVQREFESFWVASGRSKKKLADMDWTASQQVDLLVAIGRIDPRHADEIHRLRKARNKVVHELRDATPDEAKSCIRVAYGEARLPSLDHLSPLRVL